MTVQQGVTLAAACLTSLSSGTNYVFSAYAPQLAAQLSLTSTKTNVVGAAGNLGTYLSGPVVGIAVDRKGPQKVLLFSALMLFLGYGLVKVIYDSEQASVPGLVLGEFMTGLGSSGGITAAGNGVARSFEGKRRGSAIGMVYAGFGLSAFFYSNLSHARFLAGDNPTSIFLLILSLGCGLSVFVGSIYVRPVLATQTSERPASTAGYTSLAVERPDEPPSSPTCSRSPVSARDRETTYSEPVPADEEEVENEKVLEISGVRLWRNSDFLIFWVIVGLCSGSGLMLINNLGTIAKTLSYGTKDASSVLAAQTYLVSLLSVFNCLGRLVAGFASDYFLHHSPHPWLRCDRVWWLVPMSALFVASQLVTASTTQVEGWTGLALPAAMTGLAYGALFGLLPTLTLEWFGMPDFSQNVGYVTLAPAVFANLANIGFGLVYDSNVDHTPPSSLLQARAPVGGPEHLCVRGRHCFSTAFHFTTIMTLVALALSIWIGRRKGKRWP